MKILENCQKNRWCCFCKYWYDPTNSALTPRLNRDMYDVDKTVKCRCTCKNLLTPAVGNCPKFEKKPL